MILLSNFYNRNRKSYKNWPISFQILKYCDLHIFISQHSFYRITAQTFVSLNQCKKKSKYKNKYFFELGNIFPVSWLLFYNCFFTICFASSNIYKICWTMFNLSTFLRAVTRSTLRLSGYICKPLKCSGNTPSCISILCLLSTCIKAEKKSSWKNTSIVT